MYEAVCWTDTWHVACESSTFASQLDLRQQGFTAETYRICYCDGVPFVLCNVSGHGVAHGINECTWNDGDY
jgi:hypothetical protein